MPLYEAWLHSTGSTRIANHLAGSGITLSPPDVRIPPKTFANYQSATTEFREQTNAVIERLAHTGKIVPVTDAAEIADLVVNPLQTRPKDAAASSVRVILDPSRWINPYLPHIPMVLPGIDDAISMMPKGAYLAKIDLSDAFLHVRVREEDQRLLGFCWEGKFYKYKYMPWGLSTAPGLFQEATAAVAAHLRKQGLQVIVYLDDFLLVAPDLATATAQLARLYAELHSLGLTINMKKSSVVPTQQIKFLGLEIDSVAGELRVPAEKVALTLTELNEFKLQHAGRARVPLKALQSLVGRLSFLSRAVRSGRVYLRHMWDAIKQQATGPHAHGHPSRFGGHRKNRAVDTSPARTTALPRRVRLRNPPITLYRGFWDDIEWWISFLPSWNGVSIWPKTDTVCGTDASPYGFGIHNDGKYHLGRWPADVACKHINLKELLTVELACAVNGPSWQSKSVLFGADSSTVVAVMNRGTSKNPQLMAARRRIAALAATHSFEVRAVHIPGVKNKWADALSRTFAQLLADVASSSELSLAGRSWLEQQEQLDGDMQAALRAGAPHTHMLSLAANRFVHSGAELFRGTAHQREYEEFLRAASAGVQTLDSITRHLDRVARAKAAARRTHELPGVARIADTDHRVVNTEIDCRGSDVRSRSAALEQEQRVRAADERVAQNTSSARAFQTAATFLLDQAVGRDVQRAQPTRPAQHDPVASRVCSSATGQRAAGTEVA